MNFIVLNHVHFRQIKLYMFYWKLLGEELFLHKGFNSSYNDLSPSW